MSKGVEKEMNMNKIREKIQKKVHHTREIDKHPWIYTKQGEPTYTYLKWEYNDNIIHAKSRDFTLISIIQDCITMYLEETGKKE